MASSVVKVRHVPLLDALDKTWGTRLELMAECSCACLGRQRNEGFTEVYELRDIAEWWVHAKCMQPAASFLAKRIEECDNCERWYIPREFPDPWLLCPGCR